MLEDTNFVADAILGDPGAVTRLDKFTVRLRRASGHLLLPNQFQKRLNCPNWPEKKFFWPISEEEQPGDSDVFLHDVVFLIDRHSCVARSTGKFLEESFRTNVNETGKITSFNTATRNKRSTPDLLKVS